ncbi:MAG TPA: SIS domain-containing protein [Fimbriimonadaceae bacterium]|nr:SIS domain-containing protein [Fimbriimonadaceae bacterium]
MLGQWMEREIDEQPGLLASQSSIYERRLADVLHDRRFDMVLLAARGSSDHAALYARYLIEIHLQIPVVLAAPSVLTRYGKRIRYPNCLAVGISQSGSAPDVSDVLASLREDGHFTLAITNTPGSRLDGVAEHSIHLNVGEERSVAATKTYTATLLALLQLVRVLAHGGGNLSLPDLQWSAVCRSVAESHAKSLVGAEPTFSLGRGYGFSTAHETALKLMECALIPCKAYSTADFEHGPKALADTGSAIVAFDRLGDDLVRQGGTVLEAPVPVGPVAEELLPVWQIIYGQWLALACARLKGENPDAPQFIQKVTRTL